MIDMTNEEQLALDFQHQTAAWNLGEGFRHHDMDKLAKMTSAQRASQADARWALFQHVDAMWTDAKRAGHEPADNPEQYNAVAAMRDLAAALFFNNAQDAQSKAGDQV